MRAGDHELPSQKPWVTYFVICLAAAAVLTLIGAAWTDFNLPPE